MATNTASNSGSNINIDADTTAPINNTNPNPFKDTKGHHILNDTWVLWFHDMDDENWGQSSYKRIDEFNTIEKFWGIYNHIPSIVNGMWFLMRKEFKGKPIYPMWEDPACINGGAWLYKIHKTHSDSVWLDLSMRLVGETLCPDSNQLLGISISPKKHYVTIRVWNRDKNMNDSNILPKDIPHVEEAIYKAH